jgi:hypothetical protein
MTWYAEHSWNISNTDMGRTAAQATTIPIRCTGGIPRFHRQHRTDTCQAISLGYLYSY